MPVPVKFVCRHPTGRARGAAFKSHSKKNCGSLFAFYFYKPSISASASDALAVSNTERVSARPIVYRVPYLSRCLY